MQISPLAILPQLLIDGLVVGFLYAVVALGYTMVYGVLEFINFAHSEIFMVGAFVAYEILMILRALGLIGFAGDVPGLILALLVAMFASGALGWTVERVAYRPLRGAPRLVPLISAIGVSFFLQDIVRFIYLLTRKNYVLGVPNIFSGGLKLPGLQIPYRAIIVAVVALFMMWGLIQYVKRTKTGKAMRAVAQDRNTAALMGINTDKIISFTFLIGGALGGAAGGLFAVQYGAITPFIGFVLGIKAFTAAVFGGIGNLAGAVLGGLLLGVFEALGSGYLGYLTGGALNGPEYKDIFAFILLVIVMIFKPTGLLGEAVGEKA